MYSTNSYVVRFSGCTEKDISSDFLHRQLIDLVSHPEPLTDSVLLNSTECNEKANKSPNNITILSYTQRKSLMYSTPTYDMRLIAQRRIFLQIFFTQAVDIDI